MNRLARYRRAFLVGVVAAAGMLSLTQVAYAAPDRPTVPKQIRVSGDYKVSLVGHTKDGVQIYRCTGTSWAFAGPRADVVTDDGQLIATHFAGPTWQATDGSKVVGVVPPLGSVTVDPAAVPWLLLTADPNEAVPGVFSDTAFIQRVATTGGLAPAATECDPASVGKQVEVPYTADYYFWQQSGKKPGA